jgi:hypothetical protein
VSQDVDMRTGSLFGGLVFLIIGVAGLLVYFPDYQQYTSTLGQVGRALNPELERAYNQILIYVIGSAAAILMGLALLIYGVASKSKTST